MEGIKRVIELPELLPVLPVRNTVLFPSAAIPLVVGRDRSVAALKQAQAGGDLLFVVAQHDGSREDPSQDELYRTGVVCLLTKVEESGDGGFQFVANGLFRFHVSEYIEKDTYLSARGQQIAEIAPSQPSRIAPLAAEAKQLGRTILGLAAIPGSEALIKLFEQLEDPAQIADLCSTFVYLPLPVKQELLEMGDLTVRLEALLGHMGREKEKLILQSEIQTKMMERLSKDQRDHLLREQLRTIHEELGDEGNLQETFSRRIEEAKMPAEAKKIAKDELSRLAIIPRTSPEYHVTRTYLDWLVSMPWSKTSAQEIDLAKARAVLEGDHFGIERVKRRILQFLAVNRLKKDLRGPILCLLGPPGVGKTSLGRSIAKALGREFGRTSLGGVRDEAEIRGHRRTYVGALPGRLVQAIKRAGVKDPLILLDEIDKLGSDFRGDPSAAMLEVLDPEQNQTFVDHYLDCAFDLSRVFFVTTANSLDTIPHALRDRLEIIEMSSYTPREKREIARRHILPSLLEEHGITSAQVEVSDAAIDRTIEAYTHEAGVRSLKRELAQLLRTAAERLTEGRVNLPIRFGTQEIASALGPPRFHKEDIDENRKPGISLGLAWTPYGGEILHIEVTRMEGKGNLVMTGQLGQVMKESAQIALSLIRSRWGVELPFRMDQTDFHIHVPAGAVPKDGPSAGAALYLALWSLLENRPLPSKLATTGEITLRGNILPVGGVREKVLAAHRAGLDTICLPKWNESDLTEVPIEVKQSMKFRFVSDVTDLLRNCGIDQTALPPEPYAIPEAIQSEFSFLTGAP